MKFPDGLVGGGVVCLVPIFACRFMRRLATHSTIVAPELSMQFSNVCFKLILVCGIEVGRVLQRSSGKQTLSCIIVGA